jgi:hypothetical protein
MASQTLLEDYLMGKHCCCVSTTHFQTDVHDLISFSS